MLIFVGNFLFTIQRRTEVLIMPLKYAEMLAIVVHENMKLGDNKPK